jgi:hypothetical protein
MGITLQIYLDTPDTELVSGVLALKVGSFYSVDLGFGCTDKPAKGESEYQKA